MFFKNVSTVYYLMNLLQFDVRFLSDLDIKEDISRVDNFFLNYVFKTHLLYSLIYVILFG